ncbi:hypothetical protein [Thalassospira alkalitolerans]|uniref:hypothetical protein n=1 Tax=Thalassospira alkalitolerans TaxID=1293890 RepID=UPI003AA9A2C2
MTAWIEQHSAVLQIIASFATLLVWVFYAQLLFASYRRIRRPKIVINQMLGHSHKARFLISNMSQEAIHIETVLLCLDAGDTRLCEVVTDADPEQDQDRDGENASGDDGGGKYQARLEEVTLQGPLASGKCIELGAMPNLLARVRRHIEKSDQDISQKGRVILPDEAHENGQDCRIEFIVIGVYSSEKGVIGASRTFVYDCNGNLRPEQVQTTQHSGMLARRRMARLHSQYI